MDPADTGEGTSGKQRRTTLKVDDSYVGLSPDEVKAVLAALSDEEPYQDSGSEYNVDEDSDWSSSSDEDNIVQDILDINNEDHDMASEGEDSRINPEYHGDGISDTDYSNITVDWTFQAEDFFPFVHPFQGEGGENIQNFTEDFKPVDYFLA